MSCYGLLVKGKEMAEVPLKQVAVSAQLKGSLVGLLSTFKYQNYGSELLEVFTCTGIAQYGIISMHYHHNNQIIIYARLLGHARLANWLANCMLSVSCLLSFSFT